MIVGSTLYPYPSNRHRSKKESVRKLRSKGLSYKEIREKIPVAKSTVSMWCRDIALGATQRKRLRKKRDTSLKGIRAIQHMFWQRRCDAFTHGVHMAERMHNDTDFISGCMLYWTEGLKTGHAALANADLRVVLFFIAWLEKYFCVLPQELRVHLHLHSGQNERNMKQYWSEMTGVPVTNFGKSSIRREGRGHKKKMLYKGTAAIHVKKKGSTYLLFHILGAIAGYLQKTLKIEAIPEEWIQKLPYA